MQHLKKFNESEYVYHFKIGDERMYFAESENIAGFQESFAKLHGNSMRVNFYIAAEIEKRYGFNFSEKEMQGQYLYCTFPNSKKYKISISEYMSSDNFQIVLCVLQNDGRYLRSHNINISTIEKLLKEIDPWRESDKLSTFNKATGALE